MHLSPLPATLSLYSRMCTATNKSDQPRRFVRGVFRWLVSVHGYNLMRIKGTLVSWRMYALY